MDLIETTALFRAHATARITGDTAEARRLAASIGDEQRMSHLLFILTLFNQFVLEELGYEPDPADLATFTKRLHDKHYRPGGSFEALRAEAMIRAVTVESILLTEIPHTEQAAYMWAVIDELADKTMTEAELAERFELAEGTRAEMLSEAFESTPLAPRRPKAAQPNATAEGSGVGEVDTAAKLRQQFTARDHGIAAEHLRAAVAVVLEYRFGPGAGLGAGPIDYGRLGDFMSELRQAGRGAVPPPDHLGVEAVARSLYGEPHLSEPLSEQRCNQAHYTALAHELRHHGWLRANPEHLVHYARKRMTTWILGSPED
ncbi:hypothetical protein [Glycomyces sp. YM15]|uniref:hypothetical protein n=1 Tax=Glycomyces sp. YM15 TaxID=2800446 RepID=UPI001965A082|nr:hypothetical protein [Glycomyces sp. YM15]